MHEITRSDVRVAAGADASAKTQGSLSLTNRYKLEAYDADGNLKWAEEMGNLITTAGLNDALDKYLKGSGYTASFFVGLTDGTPTVNAADTLASQAGWSEVTAYAGNRPALTLGAVSGGSVDNSASRASFAINANGTTIGGAFICTVDTGTSGVLYSVAAFSAGDKALDDGDTLNVTVTSTAASA
jgi:hypothetical protein